MSGQFQQYPGGPWYSRDLFDVNVRNHREELAYLRRQALGSRKRECRVQREYNAVVYLNTKRALAFIEDQSSP